METKIRDAVTKMEQWKFNESGLKELVDDFLVVNDLSQLLSNLCKILVDCRSNFYALYKTTIIMKNLCDQYPEECPTLLYEQRNILKSLKTYSYVDSYGIDQGVNVGSNVDQLLDFITMSKKSGDSIQTDTGLEFAVKNCLDYAAEQLQQTLNSISGINSTSILEKLTSDIAQFNKYLPGPITLEKFVELDKTPKIDGILYGQLVEKIVETFDENWPIIGNNLDPLVERLIVTDGATFPMFHENLIVLTDALKKSTNSIVTNAIVQLLVKLFKSEALLSVITEVCKPAKESQMRREDTESKWQSTLQIIVSLPNRVANKLQGKMEDTFLPETYAKILSLHIGRAMLFLNSVHQKINIKPRVNMLSMLISKAIIVLGAHRFDNFIDIMTEWCSENHDNIKDFVNRTLSHIDRPAIYPIAVSFLKQSKPAVGVKNVFGDLLTNPHWKHVFTVKIPIMSYYDDENLMKNLIVYLSTSSNGDQILPDLLIRLLDIWGDRSALNHTSLEQHEYITKLIIMSLKEVKGILKTDEKMSARRLLFAGMSAHLESTQAEIRGIGMITGEIVVEILDDSDDAPKLKYEYEGMPERAREIVENLRKLGTLAKRSDDSTEEDRCLTVGLEVFQDVGQRKLYRLGIKCGIVADAAHAVVDSVQIGNEIPAKTKVSNIDSKQQTIEKVQSQNEDETLDSDDDLVPYDMSNDTPIFEKLRPGYLRDLKENLLNAQTNTDPNIFEESMKGAEELILSQLPKDDASFAIELLEILVSLRENSYVENFEQFKFNACVAIVTIYPKEAATYLCNKFHTKISEYSINDRLFMLNVLSESARKLSKIEIKPIVDDNKKQVARKERKRSSNKRISLTLDMNNTKKHETLYDNDFEVFPANERSSNDWEEIVSRRIQSNTRIFAHQSKSPATTMNRFNDIAGSFFYPLLYGFRKKETCMYDTPKSFEDQENILLVHYLKALSTIMMAAENCVIAPKMAKEIFDLSWTLRYHNQAKVRLCVIECTASIIITLPKEGLTAELMELIYEFRAWLSDVSEDGIRGDPDSNCRSLGKNVVALIDSIFRSTLNEL